MGIKFKKKNTDGVTSKSNSTLLTKLNTKVDQFSKLFGDSEKSKRFIHMTAASWVLRLFLF